MMTAPPAIKRQAASSQDINEDVVTGILLRLSCTALVRSRAVCKAWYRITTSAAFIADHARRRPLELILQRRHGPSSALRTIPLATLDEASGRCLMHVPYPDQYTRPNNNKDRYALIASCDGLLLFERAEGPSGARVFYLCNPATQQWSPLPLRPPGTFTMPCGFYVHRPSGEHRILCLTGDQQGSHYVFSLEAGGEARRLGPAHPYVPICSVLPLHDVTLGGKLLHWSRYPAVLFPMDAGRLCPEPKERDKIVAFDTESETFRRISRPPSRRGCYSGEELFLLKVDDDRMLAMADFLRDSMDLWVLEDYEDDASWAFRLRVDLLSPLRHACWAMMSPRMEEAGGHDVILLGDHRRCWVALYDVAEKRVLKQIRFVAADDRRTCFNVFVFRDSLERHAFFDLLDAR